MMSMAPLITYPDYIAEDELAVPKLARPVVAATEKLCAAERKVH